MTVGSSGVQQAVLYVFKAGAFQAVTSLARWTECGGVCHSPQHEIYAGTCPVKLTGKSTALT